MKPAGLPFKTHTFIVAATLTEIAPAHSGHDHNHWFSDGIHSLTLLAIAVSVSVGISALIKARSSQSQQVKSDKES